MNKKGFTMIEMLAAVIIIVVISVIAYTSLNAILDSARKNVLKKMSSNVIDAGKHYYANILLEDDSMTKAITFVFPEAGDLSINGRTPKKGYIKVYPDGTSEMAIEYGKWCATKSITDDIAVIELLSDLKEEGRECSPSFEIKIVTIQVDVDSGLKDEGGNLLPSAGDLSAYEFDIYEYNPKLSKNNPAKGGNPGTVLGNHIVYGKTNLDGIVKINKDHLTDDTTTLPREDDLDTSILPVGSYWVLPRLSRKSARFYLIGMKLDIDYGNELYFEYLFEITQSKPQTG